MQTRQALQAQRLEEAEASAEALAAEFPGEEAPRTQLSEVRELQAARRRAAAIGELAQAARGLIEAKRFDEAVGALEDGIGQYRTRVSRDCSKRPCRSRPITSVPKPLRGRSNAPSNCASRRIRKSARSAAPER